MKIVEDKGIKHDIVKITEIFLKQTIEISEEELNILNFRKRDDLCNFIKEIRKVFALLDPNVIDIFEETIKQEMEITDVIEEQISELKESVNKIKKLAVEIKENYRNVMIARVMLEIEKINLKAGDTKNIEDKDEFRIKKQILKM
jgi:hypothetical protein